MSGRQPALFDPAPEPATSAVIDVGLAVTPDMARQVAISQKVCVRPILRRVEDRQTGDKTTVAIPCGSTRDAVCPSCAHKAKVLRMHQCAEGWHRTDEPENPASDDQEQEDDGQLDQAGEEAAIEERSSRRVRSTRRRQDVPDLPQVPMTARTVGRTFTAPNGTAYRPSMFLTLTLPSYGKVTSSGAPAHPGTYDYRRAALDALHFSKLLSRFWENLRRCAGYKVQYFSTIEPQRRLAPHLHAAIRGAIPRRILQAVIEATYVQLWWPSFDRPVYTDRLPVWADGDYIDPDSGVVLPTWTEALDAAETDPDRRPAHVVRFGNQSDMKGIIAPSEDADRAIRYLTKYLTKAIAEPHPNGGDEDGAGPDPGWVAHVDRLHAELRWLPCSERCANWLRYGVQPEQAGPGLEPGFCDGPAHDRANLGVGGRRVLVSRKWSGKTLAEHKADRAAVVRETLLIAGVVAPETERMAATVQLPDGSPRFVWTDTKPDPRIYARVILASVLERQRWRAQYEQAKTLRANTLTAAVDNSFRNSDRPP